MKKIMKLSILTLMIFSSISSVMAVSGTAGKFLYVPNGATYIGWYPKNSTLCRNLTEIKTSIVKYGNSKKNWSTSEATKIQDKWFELQKSSTYSNVIVLYTFDNTADPNFLKSPYLASGTPQ